MSSKKQLLNKREKLLLFNLSNIGYPADELCTFFDINKDFYRRIRRELKVTNSAEYSAVEMADIITEYLLTSLARNMHTLPPEMQLRFLPDLLKIKNDNQTEEGDLTKVELYIPKKVKHNPEDEIIIEKKD